MKKPLLPDEELKKLASRAKQEKEALAELFEVLFDRIYSFFFYRVNKPEEAEDLTQAFFLRIMEALSAYQPSEVPFMAWCQKIARNLLIDHYRRARTFYPTEVISQLANGKAQKEIEIEEERAVLYKALKMLSADYQEVILLRFLMGFSVKETAEVMKRSENAIKLLQYRALKAMKKHLGEENG